MCTSVIAGKGATHDVSILLSRNEDYESKDKRHNNNWNKYMVFRRHPEYHNNSTVVSDGIWTLGNGVKVKVPERMYPYNAMPDAVGYDEAAYGIGNLFYYEERGINQHNVAISATNSMAINAKANKADPLLSSGGIDESIIPTLLLPQADTARNAVELLGNYVEKHGVSEVNGILIGDPDEAWYFEIGSCHHWIAVKIPEDSYLAVANGMRVHSVDLAGKDVLCSKNLFDFVCKNDLLDASDRHEHDFNFAKAFGLPLNPETGNRIQPYNVDRVWLAQKILTPSLHQKPRECQYPLFLKPDKKIKVQDIMTVLRATYKGTELEGIATRPIGVDRTAESHIMTLDPKMPQELQGLIWQVVSTPMGAPYMPLFSVMDDIPPGFTLGGNQYGPLSAYWSFRGLYSLCGENDEYKALVKELWRKYEDQCLMENSALMHTLTDIYEHNRDAAICFAKRYSTGIAYQTVGMANKERDSLMTKITNDKYQVTISNLLNQGG